MPIIDKFFYRAEIDGLRAVAVMAVVLYHAGLGCSGGYVGVDIFFVISGFLITSLIWTDLESGRFTFGHFWERRARRIVPALVVVTIATLVGGWFLLLPFDFKSLGVASAAQAVFGANVYYWLDSGYFSTAAGEKPLLHTWSLAVEEQFYLIAPFVLWGMFRSVICRNRKAVISVLAAAGILSFSLSVYGVAYHPSFTFYVLPTRAWELLLGSLAAFLPTSPILRRERISREALAALGLTLVLIPIFAYSSATPFPGLAALPPCLGTMLLILVNSRVDNDMPTTIGTLLSIRPLVFVGLISYSLYLWHWPFLAFAHYIAIAPLSLGFRILMAVLGILCAVLSWKYVETPFRNRTLGTSRKAVFAFAGAGLTTVLVCGLLCVAMRGFPNRMSPESRKITDALLDHSFNNPLTAEDIRSGRLVPIGTRDPSQRPAILVWGDSHAMCALPAIDAFLREKNLAGIAATRYSTAPVLDWPKPAAGRSGDFADFNNSVLCYVRDRHIPNVILVAYWDSYIAEDKKDFDSFAASLLATVQRLVAVGSKPLILLDVPHHSFQIPRALAFTIYSDAYIASLCTKPSAWNQFDAHKQGFLAQIKAAGGRILDPKPRFLDPSGSHYIIQADGIALYRDDHHLTTEGAKRMLLPLLRDARTLRQMVLTP